MKRKANIRPTKTAFNSVKAKTKFDVSQLSFNIAIPPNIQKKKGDEFVMYGADNLYPNYLLKLYNDSSMHKSIINSKVDYLLGDGVFNVATGRLMEDATEDLCRKVLADWLIFNYYALEVIYTNDGEIESVNHLPAQNIRTNEDHSHFWYKEDWSNFKSELIEYDAYDPEDAGDKEPKIYFYTSHSPSVHITYPTVEYSGALKSIEIDCSIKDFHLNNIHSGFTGNTIITFRRGEPDEQTKGKVVNSIENGYTGTKGGKLIVEFLDRDEEAPTVTKLGSDDWDDAYLALRDYCVEDIIQGHSVTSPMLFAVKTAGQLGGATELETAFQIFQKVWVNSHRREIVQSLNAISPIKIGFKEQRNLFPPQISDATREKISTINELRAMDGKDPIEGGDRLLSDAPVQPVKSEFCSHHYNPMGFSEQEEEDIMSAFVKDNGVLKAEFHILESDKASLSFSEENLYFTKEKDIRDYLEGNNISGKSFKTIQKELNEIHSTNYTIEDISEQYGKLVALRIIPNTQLLPKEQIDRIANGYNSKKLARNVNRIELRYSYDGPIDEKNRPFCRVVVRSGKLYTASDIQKMSELMGYDVFKYKGSYNCRHSWTAHSVIRK